MKGQTRSFRDQLPSHNSLVRITSDFHDLKKDEVYRFNVRNKTLQPQSNTSLLFPVNGYSLFWYYYYPNDNMPTYDELLIENQKLREIIDSMSKGKYQTL